MIKRSINKFSAFLIGLIVTIFSRLIYHTSTKKIIGRDTGGSLSELENSDAPIIYASWHGRLFIMSYMKPRSKDIYAVVSRHFDGDVIASYLKLNGSKSIRGSANREKIPVKGSKNRGGVGVLKASDKIFKEGAGIGLTPDGPKGPARKFKPNIIKIAAKNRVHIVPMAFSSNRAKIFKSWDRFMLPLPFSRVSVMFGEPFLPPEDLQEKDIEKHSLELENNLNKITDYVDSLCDRN